MFPLRLGSLAQSHGPAHQIVDLDRCRLLSRRSRACDSGPQLRSGIRGRGRWPQAAVVSCAGPVSMTMSRRSNTRRPACAAYGGSGPHHPVHSSSQSPRIGLNMFRPITYAPRGRMSHSFAALSVSLARGSPICQPCSSRPRLPRGSCETGPARRRSRQATLTCGRCVRHREPPE